MEAMLEAYIKSVNCFTWYNKHKSKEKDVQNNIPSKLRLKMQRLENFSSD